MAISMRRTSHILQPARRSCRNIYRRPVRQHWQQIRGYIRSKAYLQGEADTVRQFSNVSTYGIIVSYSGAFERKGRKACLKRIS